MALGNSRPLPCLRRFLSPRDKGVDLNHFNGTIYQLRGMADLGHTAAASGGQSGMRCVFRTQRQDSSARTSRRTWRDQDLSTIIPSAPPAAGDPTAIGIGSDQVNPLPQPLPEIFRHSLAQ
jgi:hypothetical protein